MRLHRLRTVWLVGGGLSLLGPLVVAAASHDGPKESSRAQGAPAPAQTTIRITDKALHASPGGVPRGWRFSIPPGDPKAGREVFAKFECFKCHTVHGEGFPSAAKGADDIGPDLSGMGAHHPPEFFGQAVLDPNAVILDEKGYSGPDGKSKMPDFTESMALREWIDLVAYLGSLKGGQAHAAPGHAHGAEPPGGHHGHSMTTIGEGVAGDYQVSVVFVPKAHGPSGGGPRLGHMMAFVKDKETGQDVPYLTVKLAITGPRTRGATLPPMLSGHGFHYGSDLAFVRGTYQVKVIIGPAKGLRAPSGKYQSPSAVVFPWEVK